MRDTVLLELEGVIFDTQAARCEAVLTALSELGIVLSESAGLELAFGARFEDAIRTAAQRHGAFLDETDVALATFRAERSCSSAIRKGLTLVEGARETLERLYGRVRLGLVTSARRDDAGFMLSLAQIDHLFSCTVAAEDAPGKPSPEPYLTALSRLERTRIRGERANPVAIETGRPGVRSARSAGIPVILAGDVPAHLALEADAWIPSLKGITLEALEALIAPRPDAGR